MDPVRIGVMGCGNISGIYFENLQKYTLTEVVAVADLDADRARATAQQRGVPLALTPDELIAHPDVELILNLTVPKAHASVAIAALQAGKHVYGEKPFGLVAADGDEVLRTAAATGFHTGSAPDTFLGGAHQTARAAIERGDIGEPIGAHGFMLCHGHESWHPSPEFYYEVGGGPLFDMGPYYITDLINLIGPVRRVAGMARASFPTRTITSQPKAGKVIEVETPTHIAGILEFESGAIGEITMSFDVWHSQVPNILIYGTEGSLRVPDPNGFGGDVLIRRKGDSEWSVVENRHGFNGNDRGIGVLDMAYGIRTGQPFRASGGVGNHVLHVMSGILEASEAGRHVTLPAQLERPSPLPSDAYREFLG